MRANCSVEGCERKWHAKGLCLKHYKAARRPRPLTSDERFWLRVTEQGDCWIFTGPIRGDGYGQVTVNHQKWLAHRYSYTTMVADIPPGLQLDHLCRVPACVNPYHLEPVTPYVNNMRSNSLTARRARMTHCPRGHELTPENIYARPDRKGGRMCRQCCQLREARRSARGRSA